MADMVRAMVQTGPRTLEMRAFAKPSAGQDGAVMRVEANGVCGSDIEQYEDHERRRTYPTIPGHEPIGIIEEIAPSAARRWGLQVGDRVAIEGYLPCRDCDMCFAGHYMSCRTGRFHYGFTPATREPSLWGGFAEYIYLHPNTMLHKVSKDLAPEVAVMFNPLGAGVRWCAQLGNVQEGDTVLILGCGQRGLTSVIAAKDAGAATVIVTGLTRDASKLELAREFGSDYTIDVEQEDTVARVKELTDGKLCEVVLDVPPMALEPVNHAIECVRHGGRVVLAGLKGRRLMQFSPDAVIQKRATVVGAFGVDSAAYADAIRIIESRRFPLEKLHTHTFSLDQTEHAIQLLAGEVPDETAVHISVHPQAAT